jgi:hypothetical protein
MDLFRLVRRFFLPRVFVFLGTLLFSTPGNAQLNKPNATAYNHYNDLYYITNYLGQSVVKMDRFGNKSYFVQNLTAPNNLIFADFPFGPAFIVLDSTQAKVFDTSGNSISTVSISNAKKLQDLVYDSANKVIYTTDVIRGVIYKTTFGAAPYYSPTTTVWVSGVAHPSNIILQLKQNRILFVQDTLNANLMAVDLTSANVTVLRSTGLSNLTGLAQDSEGNYYISSQYEKAIYQWNQYLTGSPKKVVGEPKPGDITVNSAKDEWVYCCILCGTVYVSRLHTFGPASEIMGCPGDSLDVYRNPLVKQLGTFADGNQFILELSSASGNFDSSVVLEVVSDTLQPAFQRIKIPNHLVGSKKYRYRYRSTKPAAIGFFELLYLSEQPKEQFAVDSMPFCGHGEEYLVPRDTQFVYQYWSTPLGFKDSSKTIYQVSKTSEWVYLKSKNGDGCVAYDSVFTYPRFSQNTKLQLKSDSILYCKDLPSNARYFLWRCNDTILMDTTKEIVVRKTGHYTLSFVSKTTNDCDCISDSLYVKYVPKPISNISSFEDFSVNVFPSPTKNKVQMHSNKMINQIRVYNALGEMIVQRNFQNTACELELAGFNNGVYVIQFKSADGFIYSKRIVKSDQ